MVQEKMNAELKNHLDDMGLKAKKASSILNTSSTHQKNSFFDFAIKAIQQDADNILEANQLDIKQAKENKKDAAFIDRLALDHERLDGICKTLEEIKSFEDHDSALKWLVD